MEVKVKPTYKCHSTNKIFDTMIEVYQHRMAHWPLDYVHGVPFESLEIRMTQIELWELEYFENIIEGCQHYGTSNDACYECERCEIIDEIEQQERDDF